MSRNRPRQIIAASTWLTIGLALVIMSSMLSISSEALGQSRIYLPVVNPRPIATQTQPGDLFLQGRVYDRLAGLLAGIEGAQVSIISCMGGRRYSTTTLPDGTYALIVPQAYANPCTQVTLEASAPGYTPQSATLSVADLRADPRRNIALQRSATVTPTATATPSGDLTIFGTVYRADVASGDGIAGALVSAVACDLAHRVETISQTDGTYSLTLPAPYLAGCDTVQLQAIAAGYYAYSDDLSVAALRETPQRDIALSLPQTQPPLP